MNKLLRALGVTAIDLPVIDAADLTPEQWVLVVSDAMIQVGVVNEIIETGDGYTFVRVLTDIDTTFPWKKNRTHEASRSTFYAIDPVVTKRRFSLGSLLSLLRGNSEYVVTPPRITDLIDTTFEVVPVTLDMKDARIAVFDHDAFVRLATIYAVKTTTNSHGSRTEYTLGLHEDFIDGSKNPVIVIPEGV